MTEFKCLKAVFVLMEAGGCNNLLCYLYYYTEIDSPRKSEEDVKIKGLFTTKISPRGEFRPEVRFHPGANIFLSVT